MRHTAVFIACFLCVLVASSNAAATVLFTGVITYNGYAIKSNGDGNQVTLAPINPCDQTQMWAYDSDGYIYRQDNKSLVLDVQNSNPNNGATVIMWNKKTSANPNDLLNQRWTVNPPNGNNLGNITSMLNGFGLWNSSSGTGVVASNNMPYKNFAFTKSQYTCPVTCTSYGDPHFTSWTGYKFNFQSPNTVLLASFSGTRIYSRQFGCAPGVTCNEGFVVHPAGTNDTFQLTGINLAYYNKQQTTVAMGTTSFGNYFNVTKTSNTVFTVWFPGGFISYAAYYWGYGQYINLGITLTSASVLAPSLCVGPASGQNPNTFGNQFLVSNQNTTAYQYAVTPFNYNPNYVPNNGPFTTNDTDLAQRTAAACNQLTSTPGYGACNALVDPTFFNQTCFDDAFALNNVAATQMSVDDYAGLCSQAAKMNNTNITFPTAAVTTVIVGAVLTLSTGVQTTFTIVAMDINSVPRTMGGDSFTITSTGPSTLTFTIVDNNNGNYTVTYTAQVEGWYTIWVVLNNVSNVSNSPFNVTVIASTSAATSSVVLGPVPTNQTSSFTIQARTSSGANRSQGGDTFTVTFSTTSIALVGIRDNNDGTYTVTYIPYTPGTYTINVQFQGSNIACSPYTVIVR